MAGGWTRDGAVQDQIDDSVSEAVEFVRKNMPVGESLKFCIECGEEIGERRRLAVPGVKTCIECQSEKDTQPKPELFNRRGSKDSQLK